jgi:hypothetical protein
LLERRAERAAAGRVGEIRGEADHRRFVELGLTLEPTAGGENEECAPEGGIPFTVVDPNALPCEERRDYESDV